MSRLSKQLLDENDANYREIILYASFTQVPINFARHSGSSSGQKGFTNTTERFFHHRSYH
jgi:hypothetical protein